MSEAGDGLSLKFSSDDINKIRHIIDLLEKDVKLLPRTMESVENEMKEQNGGFLGMLLGSLATSLLPTLLFGKGLKWAGKGVLRAGEQRFSKIFSDII